MLWYTACSSGIVTPYPAMDRTFLGWLLRKYAGLGYHSPEVHLSTCHPWLFVSGLSGWGKF
jgi:hypothetical protein